MDAPVLLDAPVGLLDEPALAGSEMRETEKINAAITARAVNVANTISAGEPRQNPLDVCGRVAGAKYDAGGAGTGGCSGAIAFASAGSETVGFAVAGSLAGAGASRTAGGGISGSDVADFDDAGMSVYCFDIMTLSLVIKTTSPSLCEARCSFGA